MFLLFLVPCRYISLSCIFQWWMDQVLIFNFHQIFPFIKFSCRSSTSNVEKCCSRNFREICWIRSFFLLVLRNFIADQFSVLLFYRMSQLMCLHVCCHDCFSFPWASFFLIGWVLYLNQRLFALFLDTFVILFFLCVYLFFPLVRFLCIGFMLTHVHVSLAAYWMHCLIYSSSICGKRF